MMSYKIRLFFYFLIVFALYTVSVIGYEQYTDRKNRIEMLCSTLDSYWRVAQVDSLRALLPADVRVTLISQAGRVSYDNCVDSSVLVDNHHARPEIIEAKKSGTGYHIRTSSTTGQSYFYYARRTDDGFVRFALPYNDSTRSMLDPNRSVIWWALVLFVVALGFLWIITRRFGLDIERLKGKVIAEAAARAALKTEMTSAIAHELRTPISAIRSYSETLFNEQLSADLQRQFIGRIHSASVRLSDLLRDVSLLTKMEEAEDKFNTEQVDLGAIASEVCDEFAVQAAKESTKIECDVPLGSMIDGNRTLIYAIFRNLVENAVKYGGSWITVKISLDTTDQHYYKLKVCDSGAGVDQKHLGRLFERFYRAQEGRTRDDGGSGLGLAIAAHAVAHHKGQITARNQQSGGLCVEFTLKREGLVD